MTDKLLSLGDNPTARQVDDFVREEMAEYFATHVNPGAKQRDDACEPIPRAAIQFAQQVGVLQYLFPREVGGLGGNRRTYGMLLEAIGYYCDEIEYPSLLSIYGDIPNLIYAANRPDLIERYVVPAARGDMLMTFAYTERNDSFNFETRATRDGDGWILDGCKVAQTGGVMANAFLVYARDVDDDLQVFIVERDDPGVHISPVRPLGFRSAGLSKLELKGVALPDDRRVIGRDGLGHVQYFLNDRRLFIVCAWPGRMRALLESLVLFLRERVRQQRPLTEMKNVQSVLGHMHMREMAARAVLHDALDRFRLPERDPLFDSVSTAAKFTIAELAMAVANDAIRLTGWAGYTDELPYHRYLRGFMGAIAGQTSQEVLKILLGDSLISQVEIRHYTNQGVTQ